MADPCRSDGSGAEAAPALSPNTVSVAVSALRRAADALTAAAQPGASETAAVSRLAEVLDALFLEHR